MSKGLVLVTGANGYIAAKTVEAFLEAGYSVRGTVRRLSSGDEVAAALPQYASQLSFVQVPDITVPHAFDEAVKGVDFIAHLAAPVSLFFTDPAPVLAGAVNGTLRALEAALTEPRIKSFVFMSSIVATLGTHTGDHVYTEADWNEFAIPLVEKLGAKAPSGAIYAASKTAAEKTVWKFRDEHKPAFTITSVNPCLVAGPPLVVPSARDKIGETFRLMSDVYVGTPLEEAGLPGTSAGYVDVRDVARLVIYGVEHADEANGERFIAASTYGPAQSVADILREAYPERKGIIREGTPGVGYEKGYKWPAGKGYDGSKAVRFTGQEWIPWERTVVDTVEKLRPILD